MTVIYATDIFQETPVVSQKTRLRSCDHFHKHESDLGLIKKSMSGGAKWKVFPLDPWRLATGDVLQASPPWGWSLLMCALAGKLREKLADFPQEICYDRFSYKSLWVRASPMRLNTPKMSPQTDAVSLCGHINIKKNEIYSRTSEEYGLEKDEER